MVRKNIKYFICFILLFIMSVTFVKAVDLSEYFSVKNVKVCNDPNCSVVYDETNGINGSTKFLVKFEWDIHTDSPIKSGDTVTIPFANEVATDTTTKYSYIGFTWSNVYDSNNNKIGQWMISGDSINRTMSLVFSDNAVGKSDLNGTFITTKDVYASFTYTDKIVPLTVGNMQYHLKIKTYNLPSMLDRSTYSFNSGNNSASIAFNSPSITMKQLYKNNAITDNAKLNNLVLEVPITSGLNARISNLKIGMQMLLLNNLVDLEAGYIVYFVDLIDQFLKINQNDGETYFDFKRRLANYQYGIYDDGTTKTIIINFGNQPSLDKTYDYFINKKYPEFSKFSDYLHSYRPFTYDSNVKSILENKLGTSNCIGGKVAFWGIELDLDFPTVQVATTKSMQGLWSWQDTSGNNKAEPLNVSFQLYPPSSIVNVRGTSKLLLRDYDSKNEIVGATIKLQKKNGDTFEDVSELTTDSAGMVSFRNLESGTYRYIQTGYLPHYKRDSFKTYSDTNLSDVITTFTFDAESGNTIYASNERERFTIKYLPGSHGNFNETVYSNVLYEEFTPEFEAIGADGWIFKGWSPDKELFVTGNQTYIAQWMKYVKVTTKYIDLNTGNSIAEDVEDISLNDTDYSTNKKDIENYEFVRVDGNKSGNRGENDIVVTYYYKKKESSLNIKYLDCNTRNEIASSTSQKLYYGDNYDADNYERNVSIPENYNRTAASKSNNYRGVVSNDNIKVDYCYNKKDSNVNTEMVLTGTDKITSSSDKVSYKIDYNALFTDYIGNYNITIVDTLPYKIDVTNSNLDGGIYDENNKTITWNISGNINSYQNDRYSVIKSIELKFISIDLNEDLMTNHVSGKIVTDDKNVTVETNHNTYIDVVGTINIKYINDLKEELIPSIESTGKVGKEYEITKKDIEGYKIVKEPDNDKYKYIEGNIDLEFVYERIKYKIVVKSLNEGGKVSGDEEVYYKEDSKEDNINIEANDGYYISHITINDKEIKIPDKKTKLTLPKFTKLDEDKYINVSFEKYSDAVVVPNTKASISIILIIVGIVCMAFSIAIIIKNKISVK